MPGFPNRRRIITSGTPVLEVSVIGRLVYPNYEELVALSAAAAVTSRILFIPTSSSPDQIALLATAVL